jgi:hypothetical protein
MRADVLIWARGSSTGWDTCRLAGKGCWYSEGKPPSTIAQPSYGSKKLSLQLVAPTTSHRGADVNQIEVFGCSHFADQTVNNPLIVAYCCFMLYHSTQF